MTTKKTSSGDFNFLLSKQLQKIVLLNDNLVYVSLHTRAKKELLIVNISEDIQTNNFVMVKMDLPQAAVQTNMQLLVLLSKKSHWKFS